MHFSLIILKSHPSLIVQPKCHLFSKAVFNVNASFFIPTI